MEQVEQCPAPDVALQYDRVGMLQHLRDLAVGDHRPIGIQELPQLGPDLIGVVGQHMGRAIGKADPEIPPHRGVARQRLHAPILPKPFAKEPRRFVGESWFGHGLRACDHVGILRRCAPQDEARLT